MFGYGCFHVDMSEIGVLEKCENESPCLQSTKPVPTISRVREGPTYLRLGIIQGTEPILSLVFGH